MTSIKMLNGNVSIIIGYIISKDIITLSPCLYTARNKIKKLVLINKKSLKWEVTNRVKLN